MRVAATFGELGLSWACDWRPYYPGQWSRDQAQTCKHVPSACDRGAAGKLCTRYPVRVSVGGHAWAEEAPGRWGCASCGFVRVTDLIKDGSRHARPHPGDCPGGPYVPFAERGGLRTWRNLSADERAAVERGELAPVAFSGPASGYRPLWGALGDASAEGAP